MQLFVFQYVSYMHTDVRLRGGKKFRHLLLVEPYLAILGKEGY